MFQKIVRLSPAFDKRHTDPKKNYGIHGVDLLMVLQGEKGAVQFVLYTNWMLPHVQAEHDLDRSRHTFCHPMPADLGYHSPTPRYEGQSMRSDECEYTGGACYCDGSGLNAERIYKSLLSGGDEAVWQDLESYYRDTFGE